ncbi:helix-turn-helix domain-containing protein [Algoriphagus yeomjeoni]|uniref:AraC-like DNA-binding protein n=1 Tax=Algoriphagus yeomjeoni TaxID=291403 RepID=A0A327PIV2_9BACT|nr:AraC family transcriptional regulator [Algoriphagus yeomjeoni]RAI92098.1 AraC-like DNA-binding protein [Algoriphagus yeomjeoni]
MDFVSSSIYHKAKSLAIKEGLPPLQFREKHSPLDSPYLPIDFLYDMYEWAIENLSPGFSVRQGMQLNSDDYGTLGLSWKTSWQARDILDRLQRYMVLVTDQGSIKMREDHGQSQLFLHRPPNRKGIEIANEVSFVMLTGILEEVTSQKILPVQVAFQHSHTSSAQSLKEFFQCPISFGASLNMLQFRTESLQIRTIKADKSIHQFIVDRLEEEKQGVFSQSDQMLYDIRQLITESLPSGIPSIIQLADHLNMSARTLKRRLAEKELTFRDQIQLIQKETAQDLLLNSHLSIAEIAFQTGFSEQSAFNRAFKRWTQLSPMEYRKSK